MKLRKKDQLEVFEPQIELNVSNPTDMGEPPVEAAGVAPTVVVDVEEEFSVEFVEEIMLKEQGLSLFLILLKRS